MACPKLSAIGSHCVSCSQVVTAKLEESSRSPTGKSAQAVRRCGTSNSGGGGGCGGTSNGKKRRSLACLRSWSLVRQPGKALTYDLFPGIERMMHNSHTEVGIMFFSSDRYVQTPKNVQAATQGGTSTGRRQGRLESKRLRHYLAIWLMMMAGPSP